MMPYKEREPRKLYYSIGEAAKTLNTNVSLIRFWEKQFDILKPKKNKKGNRLFTPEDMDNLKIIYHLVKEKGFKLQGARDYLKNNQLVENDRQKIIESLKSIQVFLMELKEEL